jgi:hypothetical protein
MRPDSDCGGEGHVGSQTDGRADGQWERERERETEITRRENGRSDVWCTARLYKPV